MFPPNFIQPVDPNDPAWANCKAGAMALNVIAQTQITPSDYDVLNCDGTVRTESSVGVVLQGSTQPIPVCVQGTAIELDGFDVCYDGVPAHIEIIRDETTGVIDRYVAHYKDGSGTIVDPADMTLVGNCPVTETYDVCDVINATITGDITYTITGADVALSTLTGLTFTNDTVKYFWTDFGNGFSDVGSLPSAIYNDGHYEIKTYAVMRSGNKLLIAAKEIDVVGGVITLVGANPQPVVNSYPVSVGTAKQEYSGSTPVGTPKNPDGSDYTVQGTLAWNCPAIIDDLEDNAEWNPDPEPKELLIPHVSGCIKRTTPGVTTQVCSPDVHNYSFAASDLIGATKIADDGNGNFTIVQELSPSAAAAGLYLEMLLYMAAPNARTFEDVGGFAQFYFHTGNIDNILNFPATNTVQYDLHLEPGVSDTPGLLPAPCVDSIDDATYQSSAANLKGVFDGATLNTQLPNNLPADFVVTIYGTTGVITEESVQYIPAKQFVRELADGSFDEFYRTPGDINTAIDFDIATDIFSSTCFEEKKADFVECTTIVGANTVTEGTDANLIAAGEVATGGGTITTYHTMLGNPGLNLAGTASGGAIVGGLNVNIGTAITGAQFTYTVNVGSDADPGDPADFAVLVWDNVAGTSVTATSIVTALPYSGFDAQGTGLNYPIYGYPNPVTNPYTIVWTGDLPVGDYTVVFLNQNQGITDNVTVSIAHNIVAGGTPVVTKAQLMALDECTIAALTPEPVVDPVLLPGGAIIVNTAALSVIAPANTRSFSVKPLIIDSNATALTVTPLYDISFDNGTTWLLNIDGGDTNGEGNRYRTAITNVVIRPSLIVPNQRVYIKWDEA
jgi:hypothetical protein